MTDCYLWFQTRMTDTIYNKTAWFASDQHCVDKTSLA